MGPIPPPPPSSKSNVDITLLGDKFWYSTEKHTINKPWLANLTHVWQVSWGQLCHPPYNCMLLPLVERELTCVITMFVRLHKFSPLTIPLSIDSKKIKAMILCENLKSWKKVFSLKKKRWVKCCYGILRFLILKMHLPVWTYISLIKLARACGWVEFNASDKHSLMNAWCIEFFNYSLHECFYINLKVYM